MEEGCGVHLDPGDVGSRTKVGLVVEGVGVGAVTGVHHLQATSHHQHNSQGDHFVISDNSRKTETISCSLWVIALGKVSKSGKIRKKYRLFFESRLFHLGQYSVTSANHYLIVCKFALTCILKNVPFLLDKLIFG